MSCSSESSEEGGMVPEQQPVVEPRTAIVFSGQQSEEQAVDNGGTNKAPRAFGSTRAATPLSETATVFKVWGYKHMSYDEGTGSYDDTQTVFPGYTVKWQPGSAATTTTNSSGWEYILLEPAGQTIKFWDWSAKAYRFFAVTGTPTHVPNAPNGPHEFTIEADASSEAAMEATTYFSHLWFSTGDPLTFPDKQFGKPVVLEFLKPYARVRFLFNYSYASEGIRIKSKSFKPTDGSKIVRKGTVTISYPQEGTVLTESFTTTPNDSDDPDVNKALTAMTEEYVPDGGPSKEIWYYVLPNNTQGSYTMSVLMNNDITPKTAVVPAQYMRWLPGYSYTYIFKILEEGGVEIELVESAVTPWVEMAGNWTVYNW